MPQRGSTAARVIVQARIMAGEFMVRGCRWPVGQHTRRLFTVQPGRWRLRHTLWDADGGAQDRDERHSQQRRDGEVSVQVRVSHPTEAIAAARRPPSYAPGSPCGRHVS